MIEIIYQSDQEPEPTRTGRSFGRRRSASKGCSRPIVLADRGFHRAGFLAWCEHHNLDYVVRVKKGTCITEADGGRWRLGEEGLKPGELRFLESVRYGLYPTDAHENYGSTWPCAGRYPRVERETPGASSPGSPGTFGNEPR